MIDSVKKEVEQLIEKLDLNCSIEEFKDKANCINISYFQFLSEDFIREFKDYIGWDIISKYQILPENFIREFKDEVSWIHISCYQTLSEEFIKEFKNYVDWNNISCFQTLSKPFIKEFKDKIDTKVYNKVHKTLSYEEKLQKVKEYCEKYDLTIDETNKCFYAYRNHDEHGRGNWNKTIFYKKGKYYKDWHLDMRKYIENSFGIGIFPKGNTKVKVLIEDFGACVNRKDGKCRVWGFEIVD